MAKNVYLVWSFDSYPLGVFDDFKAACDECDKYIAENNGCDAIVFKMPVNARYTVGLYDNRGAVYPDYAIADDGTTEMPDKEYRKRWRQFHDEKRNANTELYELTQKSHTVFNVRKNIQSMIDAERKGRNDPEMIKMLTERLPGNDVVDRIAKLKAISDATHPDWSKPNTS